MTDIDTNGDQTQSDASEAAFDAAYSGPAETSEPDLDADHATGEASLYESDDE